MEGLIVDIDDTLCDTTKYWIAIFQQCFGNPEGLTPEQMFIKYHYVQNVPYWQSNDVSSTIYRYTNSNSFQHQLPLIANANHFLKEISAKLPIICYLTKRPESVRAGTEFWLNKFSFPSAEICFRPPSVTFEKGNHWKTDYIKQLEDKVIGIIDDDEHLIRLIQRNSNLHLFLFGKSKIEMPMLRVYPSADWTVINQNIDIILGV